MKNIINGIDVSECAYLNIGIDKKCYCEQALYNDGTPVFDCGERPNCYFKQRQHVVSIMKGLNNE